MGGYSPTRVKMMPILSIAILVIFREPVLLQAAQNSNACAVLFENKHFTGQNLTVDDGKQITMLEKEYTSSSSTWNGTASVKVTPGCLFTACNNSNFDGYCQEFEKDLTVLPPAFLNFESVNCTCATNCRCSDIYMGQSSCARAYLNKGCNTCNAYYADLKGSKSFFPDEFQKRTTSVLVRPGCTLTVYDEEDHEGAISTFKGINDPWVPEQKIVSYECSCSGESNVTVKKPRPSNFPVWINIPQTADEINKLNSGPAGPHPALLAALQSFKHKRSSRNAYILLLGTTGSGKSSAINLLFDNSNLTMVGSGPSVTTNIHEFRVPVPVGELGIANSELRVIDTPGLGDTRGLEQDAKFLATLDEFLTNHEELRNRIPNVVLVFHKFNDNRITGEGSAFVKMLRGLDSFRSRITDKHYSNVIFVLSHFLGETMETKRRPKTKLAFFKKVIQDYSLFPKPVVVAVAENKAGEEELPLVNGYYRLPNGDFYPRNIFEKIQKVTSNGGDPIGEAIITAAFRDSTEFNITSSESTLVGSGNSKVSKYLSILSNAGLGVENTEISQMLANASETLDPELKKKFPLSLLNLQKALNIRNIRVASDVPRTTLDIIKLLTSLTQNDANLYLLDKAFGVKPPILKESPIAGYSYNVFKDIPLPISPLNLGVLQNSDIAYKFPAVMTCLVERTAAEIFKVFESKEDYVKYRLQSLNIDGKINASKFTDEVKPGSNIKGVTMGTQGSTITVVREIRNFELVLNDKLNLSPQFIATLKSLAPFNAVDHENVEKWKAFFNEYGTHVVQSTHGGGSIEIQITSDKMFGADIAKALYDLVQFAEDVSAGRSSNKTLEKQGITHNLKFRGGHHAFHTDDLTKMSLDDAAHLLEDWKESLALSPTILTSEIRLIPLSELAKKVSQNISSEIQRATFLLFHSSLKHETAPKHTAPSAVPGPDRDATSFAQNEMFAKLVELSQRTDERFQKFLLKMEEDRKTREERQEAERKEQQKWEREQAERRDREEREDIINARISEKERQDWQQKFLLAREKAERERADREEKYRTQRDKDDAAAAAYQAKLLQDIADRPVIIKNGCLLKGTLILMADGIPKPIEDVQVGDLVLDHLLQPTKVVAALEKFLLNDSFYGFHEEGPFFFTNSHVLAGPSEDMHGIQLLAHSVDALLEENPLFEFLNPKQMNDSGTTFLMFHNGKKEVVIKNYAVYQNPVSMPKDTLVHIIEVESVHGTYFANSVVCRHELPPIQHWPNTMHLILSFGTYPEVNKLEDIPYTLATVYKTGDLLEILTEKVAKVLTDLSNVGFLTLDSNLEKYRIGDFNENEILMRAFTNPSFGTFGAGLYATLGKKLANVLDNPIRPIKPEELNHLHGKISELVLHEVKLMLNSL